MSTAVSRGQALELASRFILDTDWGALKHEPTQDIIDMSKGELGRRFTAFLRTGVRLPAEWPSVIPIIRGRSTEFFKNWEIEEAETDTRSMALTHLDLTEVEFVTMFMGDETWVSSKGRVDRLGCSDYIRLDADIFLTLWEDKRFIPESWGERVGGRTCYINFDGTIFRNTSGYLRSLSLFYEGGMWSWKMTPIESNFSLRDNSLSAVLAT